MDQTRQITIPAALLAVSLLILAVLVYLNWDPQNADLTTSPVKTIAILALGMLGYFALGLLGSVIAATVAKVTFGPIHLASLKLAAIFAASLVVIMVMPGILDWFFVFLLYISLLGWLFELNGRELIWSALIICVTQIVGIASFFLAIMLFFS